MIESSESRSKTRTGLARLIGVLGIAASCALTSNAWAEPSAADMESARALFKEANDLRDAGDNARALAKYQAAHALAGTPITGLGLGEAQLALGHLVEAREVLLSVDRVPVKAGESDRVKSARQRAAELAEQLTRRIPSITVDLANVATGASAEVRVDDQLVPSEAVGAARRLNPGQHRVVATSGGRSQEQVVELAEGETRTVTLDFGGELAASIVAPPPEAASPVVAAPTVAPAPPPAAAPVRRAQLAREAPPAPPPRPASSGGSTATVLLLGTAIAGVAVSLIGGGLVLADKSTVKSHCDFNKDCDEEGARAASDGKTMSLVATTAFAVGAVSFGSWAVWKLAASSDSHGAHAASINLRGSF